ncbi:MAG: site-specific DNA-methyltransferase, partial [Synergistaceae bacterium]|nr:site-specific DNA-methyltransferase [Synergistaceae bacterium]
MPPKKHNIDTVIHTGADRPNNPPAGLPEADAQPDSLVTYTIDSHDSPSLQWSGKPQASTFTVPATSIHKHETIIPHRIISPALIESRQCFLFHDASPEEILEEKLRAVQAYSHNDTWQNRMIAGDSLIVMNSLLRKESMAGKVQTAYIDPPYGIKYGSNFQPFVGKRDVKDRSDDDLTAEPEMIRAFRDTWELGVHSYLTYLRSRLYLVRELLSDSGSVFVQISDENVHHVREICDEIFGPENFVTMIKFKKTGSIWANLMASTTDYLVWYAKDKGQVKYRQLYVERRAGDPSLDMYNNVELEDGTTRKATPEELRDKTFLSKHRIVQYTPLLSDGQVSNSTQIIEYEGEKFMPPSGKHWKTTAEGIKQLIQAGRISKSGKGLRYKRYLDDCPVIEMGDFWDDTGGTPNMRYVVQTSEKVISRCILMTTDPSDLVLDITCGSGTTAYCAEKWGRRWITCDTSRVAIAIARQRLMTATFDSYKLADPQKGISSGFVYKSVPHITLKSIANNEPPAREILYDQPEIDAGKVRVSGAFTVESLPAPSVMSLEEAAALDPDEKDRQDGFMSQLMATGIRGKGGERIRFSRHEKISGTRWLHSEAWTDEAEPRRALVCFADSSTLMDSRRISFALDEAGKQIPKPSMVIFCAFQFSPEAQTFINNANWPGVSLLQVEMNDDLMTEDLKKKINTDESFWLVGQPDVVLHKDKGGKYRVEVLGYDYFSVSKEELVSGDADKIAMWGVDPNYNGMDFAPSQIFFPMEGKSGGWSKLTKTLKAEIDPAIIGQYSGTESLPFEVDEEKMIAVKIIDDRGIESMRIL